MSQSSAEFNIPQVLMKKNCKNWCATEKVHGSNFAFVCSFSTERESDGSRQLESIKPAKRGDFLSEDDEFFGYRSAFEENLPNIRSLAQQYSLENGQREPRKVLKTLAVYGELFGGGYPHPDLQKEEEEESFQMVQSEILYHPKLKFAAFDVAIQMEGEKRTYLDYSISLRLFESSGTFHCRPLIIGSLYDCLDYKLDFQSTIPGLLGMPPLPNNPAEGIVVKTIGVPDRFIFKRKAETFGERVQSHKMASKKQGKGGKEDLLDQLSGFITKNRLVNLCSKHGVVLASNAKGNGAKKGGKTNKGGKSEDPTEKLLPLFLSDVMVDALEDKKINSEWLLLNPQQQKSLKEELQKICRDLFSQHL
eukprot:TRINITY_DN7369_c0_g1_i1.p1 TRINITY_DN7369_c0_g1~~TRINITY_DN7369_c0_g1_i1.p1  ORF type:complete len:374 (-),score=116.16 TRINITY_DN7369_c0_g1_i1:4-1092(-)